MEGPSKSGLIYLASAYTHESHDEEVRRFEQVCKIGSRLFAAGYKCFSPIAMSHPLVEHGIDCLTGTWETWADFDKVMISKCDDFVIVDMPGVAHSKGVAAEIELAYNGRLEGWVLHPNMKFSRIEDEFRHNFGEFAWENWRNLLETSQ